jgi:hypothetical protein
MKNVTPPKTGSRFSSTQRYYHRTGSNNERSWDDWVAGAAPRARRPKNRLKIIGIVAAALALVAVLAGLVNELM